MSNKQSSSIDWLISQLQKSKDWHRVLNEVSQMSSAKVDIIKQSKAMHKDEIIKAMSVAFIDGAKIGGITYESPYEDWDEYYNETFGGNNE